MPDTSSMWRCLTQAIYTQNSDLYAKMLVRLQEDLREGNMIASEDLEFSDKAESILWLMAEIAINGEPPGVQIARICELLVSQKILVPHYRLAVEARPDEGHI